MIDQKKIDRMRDAFDSLHHGSGSFFNILIYELSNKIWGATIGARYTGQGDDVETAILLAEDALRLSVMKSLADKQEELDSLRRAIEGGEGEAYSAPYDRAYEDIENLLVYARTPDGNINNCALANGDERKNCQVCKEQCPDRARFGEKP